MTQSDTKRPARYIKVNHAVEAPRNIVIVAVASKRHEDTGIGTTGVESLRAWCATRVRMEGIRQTRTVAASGETTASFWGYLASVSDSSRRTWVFSHNLSRVFTLLGGWIELDEDRLTLKPLKRKPKDGQVIGDNSWCGKLVIDGQVNFIVCRNERKTYTFVDTMNYWPRHLWEIGADNGIPRLAPPAADAAPETVLASIERDRDIIKHAVVDLITRWTADNCGVFMPTAAGLAFNNWRHKCDVLTPDGKNIDVVCMPDHPSHDLERRAYYGGRVQPFKVGELTGPLYHVDCNSLYPFVMMHNSFPRRYSHAKFGPKPADVEASSGVYGIVADVRIRTRSRAYPIRVNGEPYHCRGTYWTVLAGPEVLRAVKSGHVERFGRVQYYSLAPIFRSWVGYWFRRKRLALAGRRIDKGGAEFASLILKALSGKFAQHGRRWTDLPERVPVERWGGWIGRQPDNHCAVRSQQQTGSDCTEDAGDNSGDWCHYRGIAGHTQYLATDGEPSHAFPAITAFITAHGRDYMESIIGHLPADSVYYMATDSLIVSQAGYDCLDALGLLHPTDLGKFKLKGRHERGEIFGANYYELDGELTVAGWATSPPCDMESGGMCNVWERFPGIVARGPTQAIHVSAVPLGPYRPDRKGVLDLAGKWYPYWIVDDPRYTDRPKPGGYTKAEFDRMRVTDWQ